MTTNAKSPAAAAAASSSTPSSPKKSAFARLCRKLSHRRKPTALLLPSLEVEAEVEAEGVQSNNKNTDSNNKEQLRRVFNYFDEDGDGRISPAELRSCVGSTGGQLSAEEAEAAVACSDRDGDGHLGFEEFCSMMETSNQTEEEKVKELRDAFQMYTLDDNMCITPVSLRRMLRRLRDSPTSLHDCKAMIRAFDLNADGVLTFDEFSLMMR